MKRPIEDGINGVMTSHHVRVRVRVRGEGRKRGTQLPLIYSAFSLIITLK